MKIWKCDICNNDMKEGAENNRLFFRKLPNNIKDICDDCSNEISILVNSIHDKYNKIIEFEIDLSIKKLIERKKSE